MTNASSTESCVAISRCLFQILILKTLWWIVKRTRWIESKKYAQILHSFTIGFACRMRPRMVVGVIPGLRDRGEPWSEALLDSKKWIVRGGLFDDLVTSLTLRTSWIRLHLAILSLVSWFVIFQSVFAMYKPCEVKTFCPQKKKDNTNLKWENLFTRCIRGFVLNSIGPGYLKDFGLRLFKIG